MEIRVLKYFLSVAREESITGAANALNISQPALSRQLKDLEDELGAQLFIRGGRKIILTEQGMMLRKRAEEILTLVQKAENEITNSNDTISGDIYIGAGETIGLHIITRTIKRIQEIYPDIRVNIITGDTTSLTEQIDNGLLDFGLIFDPVDSVKYNTLRLPHQEIWGLMIRKDDPLASQNTISKKNLLDIPLIISRHTNISEFLKSWFGDDSIDINVVATYTMLYNGSIMVKDGIGKALCIDDIINVTGESELCFKPIYPEIKVGMSIIWKKYNVFSKAAEVFLNELKKEIQN